MSESEQFLKGTSQIKILSADDIEGMRVVCKVGRTAVAVPSWCCRTVRFLFVESAVTLFIFMQLAREVLDIAAMMVKPGVTTEEIDHAVHLV